MPSRAFARLATALAAAALACHAAPPSFRVIGLDEARQRVAGEALVVIEAPDPAHPRAGDGPAIPPGSGVLVLGMDAGAARARAAELARSGNQPVFVFVPRNADERGRFYAVASKREEIAGGQDS